MGTAGLKNKSKPKKQKGRKWHVRPTRGLFLFVAAFMMSEPMNRGRPTGNGSEHALLASSSSEITFGFVGPHE